MKWICIYCEKIMDRTNFIDFIKDSDSKEAEPHDWQSLPEEEEKGEASTIYSLA